MTTTKFKTKFLQQYALEIFGNREFPEPLLNKNLSQKIKFHLKKLGNALQVEQKQALEQVQELFNKYSEEVPEQEAVENTESAEVVNVQQKPQKRVKDEFREQFLREAQEIEDIDVSIQHEDFTEKDFIDRETGEIVGGEVYYNLLELLILEWGNEEEK